MQPDDPGHKRNKGFYEKRQCRMDGLRFINQNGGMRRPRIFLRNVEFQCLMKRIKRSVSLGRGEKDSSSRKHSHVTQMHGKSGEF